MTTPEFGVTPEGFKSKRLIDIKNELEDYFIGEFGEINLDAQSVTGQFIGIFSKVIADIWENLEDVYLSEYPNSATGISLDNVVQLNGITRLPAQRTSVIGVATGVEGTLIPSGKLARQPTTGNIFFSTQNVYITRSNSVQNIVRVNAATAQVYTILIDGVSYTFSLPTMNFSGPFVSGNVINAKVNGINIPEVTYTTSSANTFNLLRDALLTSPAIATATVVGNTIEITPTLGYSVNISGVDVTGGVSQPTYSQTLRVPANTDTIATFLSGVLNSSANVTSIFSGSDITITAVDTENPYSLNVGTNLTITQTSSPVPFLAQEYGPIPVPAGSLIEILTPVAGWQTINNFKAGVTGRNQETDEELRLRRAASLRVLGAATVEAIRARVLQEVPGVTSVTVFENVTLTQDPIEVTFSAAFNATSTIEIQVDSTIIGTVNWQGSQLATMNAIAALLLAQPEIKNVTVLGAGNLQLLIEMEDVQEISVVFNIGGTTPPTYITAGGRPPKSFETVVEGGSDAAVALKIWQLKPAGIQTFGNTQVAIIDSQGNTQQIFFSRATPIYIWVTVTLVLNPQETFPSNGLQQVANAILAYGDSLGIGVDVFFQRVQAAIFSVPGIASANVQLASTININDIPVYGTADIDVGQTEVSSWDLSRIFVSL